MGKCSCPHDGSDAYIFTWRDELHEYDEYEIDPDTHGRCTGLRDKNGTLIFEGDIVSYLGYDIDTGEPRQTNGIVEWYLDSYKIGEMNLRFLTEARQPLIIGNIHDNPKLLKAKVTP